MGVARFFFHDLCEQPLAASDYLRIAHEFHTLIIDRIPVMGFDQRNAAKRFIALIDTALESPLGQIAMIPMLAWIARCAPTTQEFCR